MKITIEKTESGYSVNGSDMVTSVDAISSLVNFIHTPLQPKEPEIPACLHCGSKDAPVLSGSSNSFWVYCRSLHGGCGTELPAQKTKAEAIALWAGVKNA